MLGADRTFAKANWLALAIPAALLAGAYYFQYVVGLPPCQMCWWQRWPHFAALALALAGFVLPPRKLLVALAALAILVSGLIGGYHAGVEYGWWEGITTCSSFALEGEDPLEAIMNAPIVRCDVAPWDLAGISLAGWNFLLSTGAALLVFALLRRKPA